MPEGKFYEENDCEDKKGDPPCEKLKNLEEDDRHCSKAEEGALSQSNRDQLSSIPGMEWDAFPEKVKDEGTSRCDTEESTYEECRKCLQGRGEGTHAQEDCDEGRDREE